MRYILLVLLAFVTTFASAQVQFLGSPTTTVRNRGNFVSDSLFYLPKRQVAPSDTAAMRYAISDSSVYVWTGNAWRRIGRAGASFLSVSDTSSMLSPYIRAAGNGLTKSGQSLLVDTAANATRARVQKAVDSINSNVALKVNISDTASMLTPYTRGSGTTNYLPKFTGSRTFGNSQLFDDGSNVGIGTTSTSSKLFVNGDITSKDTTGTPGNHYINITPTGGWARGFIFRNNTTGSTHNGFWSFGNAATPTYMSIGRAYDTAAIYIRPSTNFVGIGINNPDALFHIGATNSGSIGGQLVLDNTASASSGNAVEISFLTDVGASGSGTRNARILAVAEIDDGRTNFQFHTYNGSTSAERMRIKSDGEVLIGTTTDAGAYALQVAGSIYNTTGAVFAASSGNVGIGTNNPTNILDIQKSENANTTVFLRNNDTTNSTSRATFAVENGTVSGFYQALYKVDPGIWIGTSSNHNLNFSTNGTLRLRLNTTGELMINSVVDAGDYKLQVNGSMYQVNGAASFGTSNTYGNATSGDIVMNNRFIFGADATGNANNRNWAIQANGSANGTLDFVSSSSNNSWPNEAYRFTITRSGEIQTTAPAGGNVKPWRLGEAATVSPTSPNRTIRVEIDGTVYYIHAKTTND